MNLKDLELAHQLSQLTQFLSSENQAILLCEIALADNSEALLGFVGLSRSQNDQYSGRNLRPLVITALMCGRLNLLITLTNVCLVEDLLIEVGVDLEKLESIETIWRRAGLSIDDEGPYEDLWLEVLRRENRLHLAPWLEKRCPFSSIDIKLSQEAATKGGTQSLKFLMERHCS